MLARTSWKPAKQSLQLREQQGCSVLYGKGQMKVGEVKTTKKSRYAEELVKCM